MKLRITLSGISLAFLMIITSVQANAQVSEVFAPQGKALKGYDVVAFYTQQQPVKGNEQFTYQWKGADWTFSSQANLDSFKANPTRYEPQYGGYCAYGTSEGHKAPVEIDTWSMVDGKLYFNYNQQVKKMWTRNQAQLIQKANEQWPLIKDQDSK